VLAVWRYCVLDKKQIAEMVFELFDSDHSLELNDNEIKKMITAMYGKKGVQHDMNRLLKLMNHSQPGIVSKKEFIESALKNAPLLFPAFHLQKVLQEKVCGQQFWMIQSGRAQRYSVAFSLPPSSDLIRSSSILKMPEVRALYAKTVKKEVSVVTPLHPPQKPPNAAEDTLVMIDFGATASEKKTPVKHAVSLDDALHHSPSGSTKGHRHAVIAKQHTTGEIPDRPHRRAVISKQHTSEEKHHHHSSPSHHSDRHPQPKHHHGSDTTDSLHSSGKHSKSAKYANTKSTSRAGAGAGAGEEWVTASRKEIIY
jgi:hypothetical protein